MVAASAIRILPNNRHTPLLRLEKLAQELGVKANILAKLEFFNSIVSVNDRIGNQTAFETTREIARVKGPPVGISSGAVLEIGARPETATAECTNAEARDRGLRQFLVRGVQKAESIAVLHA